MTLLIYLHVVFYQKPITCLSHLKDRWPRQGILRVELFFQSPPGDYNLQQSYAKEFQYSHFYNNDENQKSHSIFEQNDTVRKIETLTFFDFTLSYIYIYIVEDSSCDRTFEYTTRK